MQGFLRTPWNATSLTTAQDALWQHILYRNTSSQPFMTPCARQVMIRIPGNVTPPWAGCWGPLHSCSMSTARYLPAQINRQPARPTPQTEARTTPRQGDPMSRVALARIMESSPHWRFLRFPVDAATPEFPQDLHNTRSRVLSPPPRPPFRVHYFRRSLHSSIYSTRRIKNVSAMLPSITLAS